MSVYLNCLLRQLVVVSSFSSSPAFPFRLAVYRTNIRLIKPLSLPASLLKM